MKSFLATSLFSLYLITALHAQELPSPSPAATVKQRVGLTDVEIVYSRPGVKDRVIFGGLVPYGEIWRTGANKATSFSTSTDIEILGQKLPAGKYSVFTIPGQKEWEVIFNSNTELWGTDGRKAEDDILKVKINAEKSDFKESMLFYFDHIRDESATINFQWAEVKFTLPFSVRSKDEALKNIDKALADADGTFRVYNNAARYYLDNNLDAKKALEWAQKSVSMDKKYWNVTTYSRAQAANGLMKEAVKSAEEAKTLATEAKNDAYVKQNQDNINSWKAKK